MIKMTWMVKDRVILGEIEGQITHEEIRNRLNQTQQEIASGIHPVHLVLDVRNLTTLPPPNSEQLKHLIGILRTPGTGMIVVVGETSAIMRFVIPLVTQVTSVNYKQVYTLEEAAAVLRDRDMTLTDITF
jgi:hypothetical protein